MNTSYLAEEQSAKELTFKDLFLKLWPYLRIYPRQITLILFLVLTYSAMGRALPFLFGYAVDEGINKSNIQLVYWVAAGFLAFEILRSFVAFFRSYVIQRYGNRVLWDIREKLVSHVQSLPAPYYDKNASGRIVTRVTNDVYSLGELFTQGMTSIFVALIEMGSIIFALLMVSALMTGAVLLCVPFLLWICVWLSKKIRVRFGAAKRQVSMMNALTAESINGMKVLQLYNQTGDVRGHFNSISKEYKNLNLATIRLFAALWPTIEAFNVTTIAISLLVGAAFANTLDLSAGELSAFVLLVQSFFRPLRMILEKYNQLQNSLASADRVFQMFEVNPESISGEPIVGRVKGRIEFRNVSFRYGPDSQWALKNFSIIIQPGESVALIGRTGSGKSTVVSLLQRLYKPQEGQIFVDGVDISTLAVRDLRRRVGVVQQDNFIFRGSLGENINMSNDSITKEQIEWAARQSHCTKPLDFKIEERGANLSVGERQLIAFGRVLAFDPNILVLDEATANIDSVHERLIQQATARATEGRTSLIIAHRLSTIMHCDRIVLLNRGEIMEEGSHAALMERKGRYFELFTSHKLESLDKAEGRELTSFN